MNRTLSILAICVLCSTPVIADWDPVMEAREQAEREQAARAKAAQEREIARIRAEAKAKADAAMMDQKRQYLGSAATGKSDAEVTRLYDQKVQAKTAEAYQGVADAKAAMSDEDAAARMKQATGKSFAEIQNMSDAEAEAFAKELEAKYGGQ